jgi:hypothetical protein
MWFDILVIAGICAAAAVVGLKVYWRLDIKNKKKLRANQSDSVNEESQIPLPAGGDDDDPSPEKFYSEADYVPDFPWGTEHELGEDDWLNAGMDEFSPVSETTGHPEIQLQQDGSILNVTITTLPKQDISAEPAVINLRIILPPQYSARKGEGPFDIEIRADDLPSTYQDWQDFITEKTLEEPVSQVSSLMDEIVIRPVESQAAEIRGLMDEITVRPVEQPVQASFQVLDDISISTEEQPVSPVLGLMDEITVKPIESSMPMGLQVLDEVSIRPVENQISGNYGLMDEITVKPLPGKVNIEYELLDDLITKRANYQAGAANLPGDAMITGSEGSLSEEGGVLTNITVSDITAYLNEKRQYKQATNPLPASGFRGTPSFAQAIEGNGDLSDQVKKVGKKARLPRIAAKALSTLRIYNKVEFYIQDTYLTQADILMEEPQIKGFTFEVIHTPSELKSLIGGYGSTRDFNNIKRGLKKGMAVFLGLVDGEPASVGWACTTEESRAFFKGYPYNEDLDRGICIAGGWTNPKYRDSGISDYIKHKRQMALKEQGFIFERSLVEESTVKDLLSGEVESGAGTTYKRRTFTSAALPGILGVEYWKEQPLNETDTWPIYKMFTLLILVLSSSPMGSGLNLKQRILKLNRTQ